jgi:uncharacterized protein
MTLLDVPTARLSVDDAALVEAVALQLRGIGRLGVAFSGGVDSATLLAIAAETLGAKNVVALLGVSASLASRERVMAQSIAAQLRVELIEVHTRELELAEYRSNDGSRCFHCKNTLFSTIDDAIVEQHRLDAVAYGENADDAVAKDRPGQRAASEHRVLRPLARAGVDKPAVRRIASALRLPVANKPATPCLASRIAPFTEVTEEKLHQVEVVESALLELGFTDVRVRHLGDTARIELPEEQLSLAAQDALRRQIVDAAKDAGFARVSLALEGLQSGSFSRSLLNSAHD